MDSLYFPKNSYINTLFPDDDSPIVKRQTKRPKYTPQYGSTLEQIVSQGTQLANQRTANISNLVRAMVQAQRQQAAPVGGPRRSGGPPGGMNRGIVKVKGAKPGVHGPIRPNAPIVTIRDGQGHTVQVNKSVADEVRRFLRALKRTGYNINSIGGYANRNIAGTNTRSLHSYGLAIDINPSANPVSYGSVHTNMPRGIGRLARRYGLVWGGRWHGSKKDPMHFSFPMFGTK